MAIYNTGYDAANTAVRAYLTQVGEYYLDRTSNTSSGKAKRDWERIRKDIFGGCCAYCGTIVEKPTIEHLIMFNRVSCGLHHPGNMVPACSKCNGSRRAKNGVYPTWEEHLRSICSEHGAAAEFERRREKILAHHNQGEFEYPRLGKDAQGAIRVIAESIYENVQMEIGKGLKMYEKLESEFVSDSGSRLERKAVRLKKSEGGK